VGEEWRIVQGPLAGGLYIPALQGQAVGDGQPVAVYLEVCGVAIAYGLLGFITEYVSTLTRQESGGSSGRWLCPPGARRGPSSSILSGIGFGIVSYQRCVLSDWPSLAISSLEVARIHLSIVAFH